MKDPQEPPPADLPDETAPLEAAEDAAPADVAADAAEPADAAAEAAAQPTSVAPAVPQWLPELPSKFLWLGDDYNSLGLFIWCFFFVGLNHVGLNLKCALTCVAVCFVFSYETPTEVPWPDFFQHRSVCANIVCPLKRSPVWKDVRRTAGRHVGFRSARGRKSQALRKGRQKPKALRSLQSSQTMPSSWDCD